MLTAEIAVPVEDNAVGTGATAGVNVVPLERVLKELARARREGETLQ